MARRDPIAARFSGTFLSAVAQNTPAIIYLDLNHWVHLTQARVGHLEGASHARALTLLREAVADGRAVVPLSAAHYDEVRKVKDADHRTDLALTMAELSGYRTLVNRSIIRRAELVRALAVYFGANSGVEIPPVLGYGYAHAYGQTHRSGYIEGAEKVPKEEWASVAPKMITKLEHRIGGGWHFDSAITEPLARVTAAFNEAVEFVQLRGPGSEAEEQELRTRYGYKPEEFQAGIQEVVARHRRIVAELEKRPKDKRRYEDLLGAYMYVWELVDDLSPALTEVGHTLDELVDEGKAAMVAVLEQMPTIETDTALREGNLRNLQHSWQPNDVYDLEHLSVSAAYCDMVVTEKHDATLLTRAHIDERYATLISSQIDELVAYLTTPVP